MSDSEFNTQTCEHNTLYVQLLSDDEELTNYYANLKPAYEGDSGIDLMTPESVNFETLSFQQYKINLGIKCRMINRYGKEVSYFLMARSSISNYPMFLSNSVGLIDRDYRGELIAAITVHNFCSINKGSRLVQITAKNDDPIVVELVDSLEETTRGSGFGSSGV